MDNLENTRGQNIITGIITVIFGVIPMIVGAILVLVICYKTLFQVVPWLLF